jgi:saccharopine dehydrogenase-like NADP-dependent oxidoreductase
MVTRVRWGTREARATLVDRYDEATGITAMSRTTALTTSAVAQWVAAGGAYEPGVTPLERVGSDQRAYAYITKALARSGVNITWSETG